MSRIARQRINDLFALAELESRRTASTHSNRYVELARRIGTRYNVRLPREYRELHCRGCSVYWVEGRTVRTRLRAGFRVRTCLRCGRIRRTRIRVRGGTSTPVGGGPILATDPQEPALVEDESAGPLDDNGEPEEDP